MYVYIYIYTYLYIYICIHIYIFIYCFLLTKGLRQGCPLSPYLFSLVLTHLFHDVETSYQQTFGKIAGVFHVPTLLWDLEYADDTVLLSTSALVLNRLLHLVQFHGASRSLYLNQEKCEHLNLHSTQGIYYSPFIDSPCACNCCGGTCPTGPLVPEASEIKYRGLLG